MQIHILSQKKKKDKQLNNIYIFNNYKAAYDKYEDLERLEKIPDEIFVVAYHRRFTKKDVSFF